jgi:glutamate racemase
LTAIGIFDSGVGGLTVLRALKQALPGESFLYLGDTARLPYGAKSADTIRRYLKQNVDYLLRRGVKAIVVACNSASTALDDDRRVSSGEAAAPIYGVIEPGARAAAARTVNGKIGVLGTRATIRANGYLRALHAIDPNLEVIQQACPLLVPLVEEGWSEDPVTRDVLQRYLRAPLEAGVDTLILGCTHYPVLRKSIAEAAGPAIRLIDSAEEMAQLLTGELARGAIAAESREQPNLEIWTTDTSEAFREVGSAILAPYSIDHWDWADIG